MSVHRFLVGAVALTGVFLASRPAFADVKLPAIFSEHMVLQRDATVPVWGWADPGETVTVSLAGQTQTVIAREVASKNCRREMACSWWADLLFMNSIK